ncbi:MAG: BatD family protein [Desulfuromonadaceae bacterium]
MLISFLAYIAVAQTPAGATDTVPAHLIPAIETSVDRNEILIGDVFHLTVAITRDPSVQIIQRETGVDLGQFEIKEIHPQGVEELPDGKVREIMDYQLSTFFTGEFEIPAFDILYQTADGAKGSIRTSPISITVRSLTPEEAEDLDIRDIKEPVLIAGTSRMWIIWTALLSLFAAALAAYGLRRYFKKRQEQKPSAPPLPAHEEAYLALRELRENQEWRQNNDYEYFSMRLSEILRVYIRRRWGIDAIDQTSEEILQAFQTIGMAPGLFQEFEGFFTDCDLMKFAKHELPAEDLNGLIDQAERIVDQTREQPVDENESDADDDKTKEAQEEVTPVGEA